MSNNLSDIQEIINSLSSSCNLRSLNNSHTHRQFINVDGVDYLNLSSNDYLGIAADTELQNKFLAQQDFQNEFLLSNPSSRLMTGNNDYAELETELEKLYPQKRVLVLGSGFLTNIGVLPAVTTNKDLIIADKLVHASLIDGIKLSSAHIERFRHNDLNHLEKIIIKHRDNYQRVFIVTESIFSMDGDLAPLNELVEIKERFDCLLYVDEAHAFGLHGNRGAGLASELNIDDKIDFIVATFGKALASQGAMVACNNTWHTLLVNKMRTLIFSTALPPISLRWNRFLVENNHYLEPRRQKLELLKQIIRDNLSSKINSHIFPIMIGDSAAAVRIAQQLRLEGFWVMPIRRPTVPPGTERLRISLSAGIDPEQLVNFTTSMNKLWNNIG